LGGRSQFDVTLIYLRTLLENFIQVLSWAGVEVRDVAIYRVNVERKFFYDTSIEISFSRLDSYIELRERISQERPTLWYCIPH